ELAVGEAGELHAGLGPSLGELATVLEVEERAERAFPAERVHLDVGLRQRQRVFHAVERQRDGAGLEEAGAADPRVAQAEEPFDGVAAHFPAVVDLAPGVLGGPILVALGLAIDALVERLPAQLRRQRRLKLDLTLGLVVRLRGAAAAAETEQLRLVADVAEGARR